MMKKIYTPIPIILFAISSSFGQRQDWKADPVHSSIQFTVTHLGISKVTGAFEKFEASVSQWDGMDLSNAQINFTAEIASVNTGNDYRDKDLLSEGFFNAEQYPEMKFLSRKIKKLNKKEYKVTGELTMKGVSKIIDLEVSHLGTIDVKNNARKAGFTIQAMINRSDFDITGSSLSVGEEVAITCNLEMGTTK